MLKRNFMQNDNLTLNEVVEIIRNVVKEEVTSKQKKILTAPEAAFYLNLELSYLYKLTSTGVLPFGRPNGKKMYFDREDLDAWAMSNKSLSKMEKEALAATHIATRR